MINKDWKIIASYNIQIEIKKKPNKQTSVELSYLSWVWVFSPVTCLHVQNFSLPLLS
jgi:hypothetical protein